MSDPIIAFSFIVGQFSVFKPLRWDTGITPCETVAEVLITPVRNPDGLQLGQTDNRQPTYYMPLRISVVTIEVPTKSTLELPPTR